MTTGRAIGLEVVRISGGEELVKCPFHHDRHASASWNPKKNLFYCFTCGFGLNMQQVLERTGNKIDSDLFYEEEEREPELVASLDAERFVPTVGHKIYSEYIQSRGISADIADAYGLTISAPFEDVIFPVRNRKGHLTGTITRAVHPMRGGSRYIKLGEMHPVWPMERLHCVVPGEYVLVTEGLFSALRWLSVNSTFCTFALAGARANRGIAEVLAPFTPIFLYDADKAGVRAASRIKKLIPNCLAYTLTTAPDDMTNEQLKKLDRWLRHKVSKDAFK